MKFGAHIPTSGGVWKALQRGVSIGCEIIQGKIGRRAFRHIVNDDRFLELPG